MSTVSGFNLEQFDKMMQKFEDLRVRCLKDGKEIVNQGAKIILEQQKKDAPKKTGKSAKALKVTEVRLYKTSVYAKIGINDKNWDRTKSLWYQHFGYHNNGLGGRYGGKFVATNAGWMNKSFDKCKDKAYSVVYLALRNYDFSLR